MNHRVFHRSRHNLALWFTWSMGTILIVFSALMYYLEVRDRMQALDRALYQKSTVIASSIQYRQALGEKRITLETVPLLGSNAFSLEHEIIYIRWYDTNQQLSRFIGMTPPVSLRDTPGFQTIVIQGAYLRQLTLPVYQQGTTIGYLQIAISLSPFQESTRQLRLFLSLGVPLALGLISLAGWILGELAMQPIRRSYEQLQRFTADASHELRAPLAAVLSNAQVGLLAATQPDSPQSHRLKKIVEITKSMSTLVSQLLFLSRHQGPLDQQNLQEIDLIQFLAQIAEEHQAQINATQSHQFISHLPEKVVSLQADPDLLRQAITNLLSNAHKYTPAGGLIQLRCYTHLRRAIIEIKDTGIGIPAEDLPHIFDRFYRVDTARLRHTGGFGLGLAIARQIIEVHRGKLTATSELNQGSTFQIELPLKLSSHG